MLEDTRRLRHAALITAIFVGVLWWIKVLDKAFVWSLHELGVYPLQPSGLIGIVTAPLIHGSFEHAAANTLPLLLLGTAVLYGYPKSRWWVVAIIWVVSGLGVWLWGRETYHYGASGLTHGLMFFLFVVGVIRRDPRSAVLAMVAFFMYGGMVWGIFPGEPGISFELHLFGAVGGIIAAIVFRRRDPKPSRQLYSWELEPEEAEDPVIGDIWKEPAPPSDERHGSSEDPAFKGLSGRKP